MAGATCNALNPNVSGARTHRNAIVSGPYGATSNGDSAGRLNMNAVGIRTPTRSSNDKVLKYNVMALVD